MRVEISLEDGRLDAAFFDPRSIGVDAGDAMRVLLAAARELEDAREGVLVSEVHATLPM